MSPDTTQSEGISAEALSERMVNERGPRYWRSFDELAKSQEVDQLIHKEFPNESQAILDPVSRRNFIKLMGASMMLAGLANCARQPSELIVPYVKPPEELISGKPNYYATAMSKGGYAFGLVATSFEGRPTKVEGLREHPASLGSTDVFAQASVLDLYDPARLDAISNVGYISTWTKLVAEVHTALNKVDANEGDGLRILTENVTSPTVAAQLTAILAQYPKAQWHQWEPASRSNVFEGAELAFDEVVETIYDFSKAKVVLSLDANFLAEGPAQVRYQRDFAASRDFESNGGTLTRLYVAETSPTITGASADHKVNLRFPDVESLALAVAQRVGVAGAAGDVDVPEAWLNALVEDLQAHRGEGIVVAGEQQPPVVHALAHSINQALGNAGATCNYVAPAAVEPTDNYASIASLTEDMNADKVSLLYILGGNPVYNTPGDIDFAAAMEKVDFRLHLTRDENETSTKCHWSVPEAHYLEAWSDLRAYDGTVSIVQPLIQPLNGGRTAAQLLAVLLGDDAAASMDLVQQTWRNQRGPDGFDAFWQDALSRGIVDGTASAPKSVTARNEFPRTSYGEAAGGLDLVFRLDPCIHDGYYANNGWLQELPKPLTKLTWDNAVFLNPATAREQHLSHEDEVTLTCNGRTVKAAVMIQFGHPRNVATVHLGYGRTVVGPVGEGRGFNATTLQNSDSPWYCTGADLKATGKTYMLARTEEHWQIEQSLLEQGQKAEDRHLVREANYDFYQEHHDFAKHMGHPAPDKDFTLYKPDEKLYTREVGYKWAMTIDLNKCTGCNVCTIACQSENNIPIVGKEEVQNGREMHWIRVDRYYRVDNGKINDNPQVAHQPIPCMQCENAPCEPVCPVGATMHSSEGLNDMVYNRCVGTRYCSNNCPYKVRRFNFFHWQIREGQNAATLKMLHNPNVTVRSRGVMEKCTYCVQRINIARIDAKVRDSKLPVNEQTGIRDGEVVTACQSACPSKAIVFGNVNDHNSAIAQEKAKPRDYGLIEDIGTRPRTTYLARVWNKRRDVENVEDPHLHGSHGGGHGDSAHGNGHAPEHLDEAHSEA